MFIQTKYEIGDRVWIVYENKGEACVYDDYIDEICVDDNRIYYMLKETCMDIAEDDVVPYEDTDKLIEKIKQIMEDIGKKESEENA